MSKDNEQAQQGQNQDQQGTDNATQQQHQQSIDEQKLGKMSESELRELAKAALDAKRAANGEAKQLREELQKFKDAENKRAEEELSWKERFEKKNQEFDAFKQGIEKKELQGTFTQKAMEAGLPAKIAKVAVNGISDLSTDNVDEKVKAALKEFSEFVKKDDEKPKQNFQNPFANAQPKSSDPKPTVTGSVNSVHEEMEARRQGKR